MGPLLLALALLSPPVSPGGLPGACHARCDLAGRCCGSTGPGTPN